MTIPKPLRPLYDGWMAVSHWIGLVMSSIILSLLWVFVFGAYALILKTVALFGARKHPSTYWSDVSEEVMDFQHQF